MYIEKTDRSLMDNQIGGGCEFERGTEDKVTIILSLYSLAIIVCCVTTSFSYIVVANVVNCMLTGLTDH